MTMTTKRKIALTWFVALFVIACIVAVFVPKNNTLKDQYARNSGATALASIVSATQQVNGQYLVEFSFAAADEGAVYVTNTPCFRRNRDRKI